MFPQNLEGSFPLFSSFQALLWEACYHCESWSAVHDLFSSWIAVRCFLYSWCYGTARWYVRLFSFMWILRGTFISGNISFVLRSFLYCFFSIIFCFLILELLLVNCWTSKIDLWIFLYFIYILYYYILCKSYILYFYCASLHLLPSFLFYFI